MRERFIFIPIYFPEFDLSGAKLKLYYLVHTIPIYEKYEKDTNRIWWKCNSKISPKYIGEKIREKFMRDKIELAARMII